ncbi:MAG: hypothetical protein IPO08_19810 [Xanthomonadales bacterium]|nr:hypothetical protein [Xanthomonadales bacterium]
MIAAHNDRLKYGEHRFSKIESVLDEIALAVKPIPSMQADIAATKDAVEVISTVKSVGKFIKWLSAIIAAISVVIVAVKVTAASFIGVTPK